VCSPSHSMYPYHLEESLAKDAPVDDTYDQTSEERLHGPILHDKACGAEDYRTLYELTGCRYASWSEANKAISGITARSSLSAVLNI
jgi:hypothetical protein